MRLSVSARRFVGSPSTSSLSSFVPRISLKEHNQVPIRDRHSSIVQSLFGFLGGRTAPPTTPEMKVADFVDNAPSWEDLEALLNKSLSDLKYSEPDLANGPASPYSLRRTFGQPGEPRLKLYRDRAAWCPYCHKVWLLLEEKRVPYTIEWINMRCYGDKPQSFLSKVPSGLLPVIELDGKVVTESDVIMRLIERTFPEKPMLPKEGTPERERAEGLLRLERQFFSTWLGWLCAGGSPPSQRARFESTLQKVEEELGGAGGPFFLGAELSYVDCAFVPFIERAVASMVYYKGFKIRATGRYPNIDRWFEALEKRDTYIASKSDFYTHCHDLPPQLGGCGMSDEGVPFAEQIDGLSWTLPLAPLDASPAALEPYSPGENPPMDRVLAAKRLIANRQAIVPFALRGCGRPGPRPVSAPLSDPTAIPGEQFKADGDAALRHVAHALLVGPDAKQQSAHKLAAAGAAGVGGEARQGVPAALSLDYLADRVGVPRDLTLPQARQLRAHLKWFASTLSN